MSPYSSSREQQRQAIDAEIKSSKSTIEMLNLKHRRNVLAPVSSLPVELIAAIFSYLRLPPSDTSPFSALPVWLVAEMFPSLPGILSIGKSPGHRPKDWLCAAHVCHAWREIALNDPLFWNHVDFTNLRLAGAAEILARAKKMPLHFEARETRRFWEDDDRRGAFENELQSRVSRICHLRIGAGDRHLRRILDKLDSPAPTLEYLSLSREMILRDQWSPFPMPDTLFDGTAPRLSRLELRNVDVSWNSPLLKGLRYLEIREPSYDARPTLAVWLDALHNMPSLKNLVLLSASPIAPPFPFDIERVVTLPSLTHLDISASAEDCALALAHLALPALTRLCLAAQYSHRLNGQDLQNLFPYVGRHASRLQDTRPLESALIHRKGTVITFHAWPVPDIDIMLDVSDSDPSAFVFSTLSARVSLFITSTASIPLPLQDQDMAILNTLMIALPLDSLVTLTVRDHRPDLSPQFWHRHSSKWPLLRRVKLTPSEARGFREMLLQGNGSREYPLLPSLTELVLTRVALSEHRTLRLCDALMARVEQGVPLETLDLRECQATSDAIDLLREIVVDVWEPFEITSVSPVPWDTTPGRFFVYDDSSGGDDYSDNDSDVELDLEEMDDYSDVELD